MNEPYILSNFPNEGFHPPYMIRTKKVKTGNYLSETFLFVVSPPQKSVYKNDIICEVNGNYVTTLSEEEQNEIKNRVKTVMVSQYKVPETDIKIYSQSDSIKLMISHTSEFISSSIHYTYIRSSDDMSEDISFTDTYHWNTKLKQFIKDNNRNNISAGSIKEIQESTMSKMNVKSKDEEMTIENETSYIVVQMNDECTDYQLRLVDKANDVTENTSLKKMNSLDYLNIPYLRNKLDTLSLSELNNLKNTLKDGGKDILNKLLVSLVIERIGYE